MATVKLIHPTKEIEVVEEFTAPFQLKEIKRKWKYTYGNLYSRCRIEVEGFKKNVLIEYIKTGQVFSSCSDAGNYFGFTNQFVNYHVRDPVGTLKEKRLFRSIPFNSIHKGEKIEMVEAV